jgi:hypothetical protein
MPGKKGSSKGSGSTFEDIMDKAQEGLTNYDALRSTTKGKGKGKRNNVPCGKGTYQKGSSSAQAQSWSCPFCASTWSDIYQFQHHLTQHPFGKGSKGEGSKGEGKGKGKGKGSKGEGKSSRGFTCFVCEEKFTSKDEFNEHLKESGHLKTDDKPTMTKHESEKDADE